MLNFKIESIEDIIFGAPQNLILDGEGEGEGSTEGGEGEGSTEGNEGDSGIGGGSEGDSGEKSFSQEEVNNLLATQKKKIQTKTSDAIKQLDNMKKTANLTKSQKEGIEKQLNTLRATMETEKQRASREKAAQKDGYDKQVASLTAERDRFKNLHTSSTIKRSIADAASGNKAIHNEQVMAILEPNTTLTEDVDAEGNGLGSFSPTVEFTDVDKDGAAIKVNYTPAEAVKRMTEMSMHSNLFESTNVGGAGRRNDNTSTGSPKSLKEAASSNESWLEERKRLGLK